MSEIYVIIGSGSCGVSKAVLAPVKTLAQKFNAKVIHIGPLVTRDERNMYDSRAGRVKTWERAGKSPKGRAKITAEMAALLEIERERRAAISQAIPGARFLTNDEGSLHKQNGHAELRLGDALLIASPVNGERVSCNPISDRVVKALRAYASSVIGAHPIVATRMYPMEKQNEAWGFWTTGAITRPSPAQRASDMHRNLWSPCCLLVVVDKTTGRAHIQRLHISRGKQKYHIAYDGLEFSHNGVRELPSYERGVFITDCHSPMEDNDVLMAFERLIQLHQPKLVVDGGDTSDYASVNHHTATRPVFREKQRLLDDLAGARDLLHRWRTLAPTGARVVMLDSNHAEWVTLFVEQNPAMMGIVDWPSLAKGYFQGFEIKLRHAEGKSLWFGDLALKHGDQEGTLTRANVLYRNYLCGHHHTYGEIGRCVMAGCATHLAHEYAKGRVNAWQHQITSLTKVGKKAEKHCKFVWRDGNHISFVYRNQIVRIPCV